MDRRTGKKKPRIDHPPDPKREIPAGARTTEDLRGQTFSWRVSYADFGGDWSWGDLLPAHVDDLHAHLCEYESTAIHELRKTKRLKDIPVEHMRVVAQQRLSKLPQGDVGELTELRFGHKWRAWGIVNQSTFYFLWWDPDHTACGPPPKGAARQ